LICIVLGQAGVNASKQKFVQNANGSAVGSGKTKPLLILRQERLSLEGRVGEPIEFARGTA
jgi:hypothetical protein